MEHMPVQHTAYFIPWDGLDPFLSYILHEDVMTQGDEYSVTFSSEHHEGGLAELLPLIGSTLSADLQSCHADCGGLWFLPVIPGGGDGNA